MLRQDRERVCHAFVQVDRDHVARKLLRLDLGQVVRRIGLELFQANGGSMVMLAKGNRSRQVVDACKKHKGFYLGSIGGPAAILAKNCIRKVEVLEYPELGMEAIWRIQVENFPAFIVTDDKGNDFFSELKL